MQAQHSSTRDAGRVDDTHGVGPGRFLRDESGQPVGGLIEEFRVCGDPHLANRQFCSHPCPVRVKTCRFENPTGHDRFAPAADESHGKAGIGAAAIPKAPTPLADRSPAWA